jgi:hypothetical protein
MKLMRSTWTDSRLDDLNGRVTDLSGKVSEMDHRLTNRVDALQHTMIYGFIAIMVGMMTGFLGLAGVLITKL